MKLRQHGRISTKFVLLSLASMLLMMLVASTSSAQNSTISTANRNEVDAVLVPRRTVELAKKAADEVAASRILIQKQDREILLLQENSMLKDQVIKALTEVRDLQGQQLAEKDVQIAAEQTARQASEKQFEIQGKELAKAKRSAKLWRKIGTVTGAALAAVFLPKIL